MAIRRPEAVFQGEGERSPHDGQPMTLNEYLSLPEEKPYLEYWDGVVSQKAVPKRKHRRIQKELVLRVARYEREHGGDSGPEGLIGFRYLRDSRVSV